MVLPIPDMYPRADRARQSDPAIFGNDCETWRSTYTEKTPGMPQVLLIEQSPRAELLAHYHASDQFQIFIEGEGKLGAHVVKPVSIHYTNRYTGYGPIVATGEPIQYFVLRPSFDPLGFGQYLFKPELREKLRAHPGPKRVLMADVEVRPERALEDLADVQVRHLFAAGPGESDSGLLADVVELGASHGYTGPDPREGGGQVILVLQGSIVYGGREMGARSALAVTGDEKPVSFAAGAKGLQALLLQYPRRTA
ncbi:MAG: hypothetical protein ACXWUH_17560 [Burkholderiales bacterium]